MALLCDLARVSTLTSAAPILKTEALTVRFGGLAALTNVSLAVPAGVASLILVALLDQAPLPMGRFVPEPWPGVAALEEQAMLLLGLTVALAA